MTIHKLLFATGMILSLTMLKAQTQPSPQALPYRQNFDSFKGKSRVYPDGIIGWKVAGATPSIGRLYSPTADIPLTNGDAATFLPGIFDFDGKIGLASNYNNDNSISIAINTIGTSTEKTLKLSFIAMVMRNLYDGTTNNFVQGLALMYRIGNEGNFKLLQKDFISNADAPINKASTKGVKEKEYVFELPKECNNQPIVQIRWVMTTIAGTAPEGRFRPNFALDNIVVN